ncbi:MAG: hypothetical protein IPG93_09375 [Burkholderiales bacterium]|nr:hypothetical protein [Burkholderiales bacterium]
MINFRRLARAGVLVLAASGCAYSTNVLADDHRDSAWFDDDARPYGVAFPEWTARLWQHVLSLPSGDNPLLDNGVNKCAIGQSGPVWFLAGNLGGVSQRACDVPADKALLFPVFDAFGFDTPGVCGQGAAESVRFYREGLAAFVDGVSTLDVELDGRAVPKLFERRYRSTVFSASLPADNFFNDFCADLGGVPRGIYSPAVDDGYYLMLKPLSVGRHNLRIRAGAPGFELDVTYKLNIVPVVTR